MIDFPTIPQLSVRQAPFLQEVPNCDRTLGFVLQESVHLLNGPIESHDGEAMVGSVHDQVLAHDGQTNEAEITTWNNSRRSTDIDAGETGATVSRSIPSTEFETSRERRAIGKRGRQQCRVWEWGRRGLGIDPGTYTAVSVMLEGSASAWYFRVVSLMERWIEIVE